MEKLTSTEKLESLRNKILSGREKGKTVVHVCMTGCRAHGSVSVRDALLEAVRKKGLSKTVEIRSTGCHGFCAKAPVIAIEPQGIQYQEVGPEDAHEIVDVTLGKNELIDRLAYRDPKTGAPIHYVNKIPFYARQEKRVLANCGRIDPTQVENYIAAGGYRAIAKALTQMTPERVIDEVTAAKLRGRGGGRLSDGPEMGICPKSGKPS